MINKIFVPFLVIITFNIMNWFVINRIRFVNLYINMNMRMSLMNNSNIGFIT